jgi:hypothetical protein
MSNPRQVRLAGSVLDRSRHVCALFHMVDPRRHAEHLRRLQDAGIDVAEAERNGQLEVRRWEDAQLREGRQRWT